MHHGLANAVMLPESVKWLEKNKLNSDQLDRIQRVETLFKERGLAKGKLSDSCHAFIESVGIKFGLRNHKVREDQLNLLADKAIKDGCHGTNMIPVKRDDLYNVYRGAF
jgi:alcohol dehydrogenase class IV